MNKIKISPAPFFIFILVFAISGAAFAETYHYATTDMTWAEFYAGEVKQTSSELEAAGLDAYTSATTRNYTSFPLTSADVKDGKTYYYGLKGVQVRMTEDVYNMLSNDSRYSFDTAAEYTEYKDVTAKDTFSAMNDNGKTITSKDVTVTASSGGSSAWGTYTLKISADINDFLGIRSGDSGHGTARNLLGAIVTVKSGDETVTYGMRPNSNTFSEASIALTVNDSYSEPHNADNRPYEYTKNLAGNTVTQIKYILKDSPDLVIDDLNVALAEWTDASVEIKEPVNGSGFLVTGGTISFDVEFSGVPAGTTYTVKSVTKPGARRHSTIAIEYEYADGVLTLTSADQITPVAYTVIFNDSADKYVDLKTTFTLYTTDASAVMSNNAAGLMFRITPAGAVSSVDATLEKYNLVNATEYTKTTSGDNSSAAYTSGENEITGSGFTFDVALDSNVPDGKTPILGFGGMATLTASTLGSADFFSKAAARIKENDYAEEAGQKWYSVDKATFKELGISVKSVSPDRDLTPSITAGAMFKDDSTIILAYGAMLADSSNSITEGLYILSPEGEMLLNDGAADGHIKATWYLAGPASSNVVPDDNSGTSNTGGKAPVSTDFAPISDTAKKNFKTDEVKSKIEEKIKEKLSSKADDYPFFSELPANAVSKTPKNVTASELASVITTGRKSFDIAPLTFPTVSVDTAGTYPLGKVPTTNLSKGMKLFIYMLIQNSGVFQLGGTEFFNMTVAEDSTNGAFLRTILET